MANSSNQDPFNLPPSGGAVDAPKIPHSNEPVRREFDKTDLGDVYPLDDSEALEAAVPDFAAQTPTEQKLGLNAPEVTIPSRGPAVAPEAPVAKEAPRRKGLVRGVMAGAAILGGAAFVATRGGGGEAETSERPTATAAPSPTAQPETDPGAPVVIPATEAPAQAPTTTAAAEAPAGPVGEDDGTEVDGQTAENPEVETDPRFEPVLMTATSIDELAEQYVHNYNCMLNAPSEAQQNKCMYYMMGDLERPGTMPATFSEVTGQINEYRQTYPDYKQTLTYTVMTDSEYSDDKAVLVAGLTTLHQNGSPGYNGPDETVYARMFFERSTARTEDGSVSGEEQRVWVITSIDYFEPGEVSID